MPHRAVRQIVQDYQTPFMRPAIGQRPFHPTVRIPKIARNGVPQHAGISAGREPVDHGRMQQTSAKPPRASVRTKQPSSLIHPRQGLLGAIEFLQRTFTIQVA